MTTTLNSSFSCHLRRMVKIIQKRIPVDIYGKCGTLKCERSHNKSNDISGQECFTKLAKDYKFYFAFENVFCADYITEKLFMAAE